MSQPFTVSPNAFRLKRAGHVNRRSQLSRRVARHRGSCAAFRSQIRSQHSKRGAHRRRCAEALKLSLRDNRDRRQERSQGPARRKKESAAASCADRGGGKTAMNSTGSPATIAPV